MIVPNTIKERLQAAREGGQPVTQRALANALGVNAAHMCRIVSGEIVPSEEQVEKMAAHLGCEPTDLYPAPIYEALQTMWHTAASQTG